MRPLRIFTWHIHGNYLYYLSQCHEEFYIPTSPGGKNGYGGRGRSFAFGPNVHEVPENQVPDMKFDCVLYQSRSNWERDQFTTLSAAQRELPRIYLEHDPPRESPVDQTHWMDDPRVLLVHVTNFNALMWHTQGPSAVIEHGVLTPADARYTGHVERGLVVVNNLSERGRRVGADLVATINTEVPLDITGMGSAACGGRGEVPPMEMPYVMADYRFFLHPMRWTSLGLALCEAMMVGMPILGVAATELPTVIRNGESGFIETDPARLAEHGRRLLADPGEARRLGARAREVAMERFGIERFARDWEAVFESVTGRASDTTQIAAAAGGV
jgi:glycosyltransferase involved in cell wall biosynthesis